MGVLSFPRIVGSVSAIVLLLVGAASAAPRPQTAPPPPVVPIAPIAPVAPAEPPAAPGRPGAETLTNATVIELLGMGFGDPVILEKMASSRCAFDLSMDGLRQLKGAKASDPLIAAMMRASTQQGAADSVADVDVNDPNTPHASGIWLFETVAGKPRMVQLDPTGFTQEKSGGHLATMMSYGIAKSKDKGLIRGAQASLRVYEEQPTFYFYFEAKNAGLSNTGTGAGWNLTSPNEFALVQVTVKNGSRELIVGQANAYKSESGTMTKDVREFDQEKIADGAYRVVPRSPLLPGEYCFYAATTMAGGMGAKVFDFGIE